MKILDKVLRWDAEISGNKSMNEVFIPTSARLVLTCRVTSPVKELECRHAIGVP